VAAGTVSVYLFKGFATSQLLAVYGGDAAGEAFGSAVAGGRDVDFDGLDDLVIGAPQYGGGAGRVVVRNGLDGTLHANAAGVPGESVGTSVALLGPIDAGNSASAVATSLPKGPGATVILHDVVGTAGPPSLVGTGTLHDLAPTELLVTQGKPVSPLWFVVGLTAVHLPLKGGVLVPSPDMILPGMTDAAGDFSLGFAWPPGLPPLFELRYQAWIADPQGVAGFTATNGLLSKGPPVP